MNTKRRARRAALTLLEMIIASSMLAMLLTSISVIMRTSRTAWDAHQADFARLEPGHATVRHIVREIRQAKSVVSVTADTDNSGQLSLIRTNGDTIVWDHDGSTNCVNFGVTTADSLLSPNITGLRFTCYKADAVTATTDPAEVQCILVEVQVTLPREVPVIRTMKSWAWLRSW